MASITLLAYIILQQITSCQALSERLIVNQADYWFNNLMSLKPFDELSPSDRLMVIAPHPDDETLSTGGLLSDFALVNANYQLLLLTNGNRRGKTKIRQSEFFEARVILGLESTNFRIFDFEDGQLLDEEDRLKSSIEHAIDNFSPTIIIAPHLKDGHKDHRVVGKVTLDLFRSSVNWQLYHYLIHFPPFFPWPRAFRPDQSLLPPRRLDDDRWVSYPLNDETVKRKEMAVKCYGSQLKTSTLGSLMMGLIRTNELFYQPRHS